MADASARCSLLAVVTIPPLPVEDGFSLRVANLLRELGARWSITLVAPVAPARAPYPAVIPGVTRLETVPFDGPMAYMPWQYDSRPLRRRVDELVAELKPEALLLWSGAEFVAFDRPGFPAAVVDRIDCVTLTAWRQARTAHTLRQRLSLLSDTFAYARYERQVGKRMREIVLVGESDAAVMRKLGRRDNVHVISNGVEVPGPEAATVAESADPTMVFSGVLNYAPNVDAVLYFADHLLPGVRALAPNATFVVAGRSPTAEIRALADRPGIRILADVPDMRAVVGSAWISVAPMQSGSGVKNKILEAWAMAKPVVMTTLAANGLELDAHASTLVTDHPDEVARLIAALLRDKQMRRTLGEQGRALVQRHHSWSGVAGDFDRLLQGVATR